MRIAINSADRILPNVSTPGNFTVELRRDLPLAISSTLASATVPLSFNQIDSHSDHFKWECDDISYTETFPHGNYTVDQFKAQLQAILVLQAADMIVDYDAKKGKFTLTSATHPWRFLFEKEYSHGDGTSPSFPNIIGAAMKDYPVNAVTVPWEAPYKYDGAAKINNLYVHCPVLQSLNAVTNTNSKLNMGYVARIPVNYQEGDVSQFEPVPGSQVTHHFSSPRDVREMQFLIFAHDGAEFWHEIDFEGQNIEFEFDVEFLI